jgi:hypothetical protein
MNDLYEQYEGRLVKIDLNHSVLNELPYVARIKAVDGESVQLGYHLQYQPSHFGAFDSALEKVLKIEHEGIEYARRNNYDVKPETLLSKYAIARITACKEPKRS